MHNPISKELFNLLIISIIYNIKRIWGITKNNRYN